MHPPESKSALVFITWGSTALSEIGRFLDSSTSIDGYDLVLITDTEPTHDPVLDRMTTVVRADFRLPGHLRKCEMLRHLPKHYDAFCFLDTDTIVLGDISLGFEKAAIHGIAASPAPHYSLDQFWGFDAIMEAEGVRQKGQLQYNTGVIFFSLRKEITHTILRRWEILADRHKEGFQNDQPYFTLAMEMEGFSPYTLSIGYNYRGFGDHISGLVRIWHSHGNPPPGLNEFKTAWPPRRAWPGQVETVDPRGPDAAQ